ncbi:MAG: transglutaminase-like domain-containing protein [Pseudomonadales bacterium]
MSTAPQEDIDRLLSGEVLFGERIDAASPVPMLALDDQMKQYVDSKTRGVRHAGLKLKQLLQGMVDDGLLTLEYDPNLTHSARETFYSRQGNCMSFSVLFLALAREAGLDARFQIVDVPPNFSSEGELVLLNEHINVVVQDIRHDGMYTRDHVVDFNTAEYSGNYDMKRVSDDYMQALFHSNQAVEHLYLGDERAAFAQLKTALGYEESIAGLWVNLGVLYARKGFDDDAITAYKQALWYKSSNRSALVNLALAYERVGLTEQAKIYRGRVDYYRTLNPYYHYYLARDAYSLADYQSALTHIANAIKRKNNEHQFYRVRGLAEYALGDRKAAQASLETAESLAGREDIAAQYSSKLEAIKDG